MSETLQWFYYLHTNGELIAKRYRPDWSDFVRKIWSVRLDQRETGYTLLIEAGAMGARMSRVLELAQQWKMDGDDGLEFCSRAGLTCLGPTDETPGHNYTVRRGEGGAFGDGSSPLLALISYVRRGGYLS